MHPVHGLLRTSRAVQCMRLADTGWTANFSSCTKHAEAGLQCAHFERTILVSSHYKRDDVSVCTCVQCCVMGDSDEPEMAAKGAGRCTNVSSPARKGQTSVFHLWPKSGTSPPVDYAPVASFAHILINEHRCTPCVWPDLARQRFSREFLVAFASNGSCFGIVKHRCHECSSVS